MKLTTKPIMRHIDLHEMAYRIELGHLRVNSAIFDCPGTGSIGKLVLTTSYLADKVFLGIFL